MDSLNSTSMIASRSARQQISNLQERHVSATLATPREIEHTLASANHAELDACIC